MQKKEKQIKTYVMRLKDLASRDTPKMETIKEEIVSVPEPKKEVKKQKPKNPPPTPRPKKPAPRPKQVVEIPDGFAAPPPPPPPKKRSLLPRGLILNL